MAKRSAPEVNAGSMADIAFLLLIFFLVTTTIETDSGLNRKLPPIEETEPPIIKEKNIFQLLVNKNDQLFLKSRGEEKIINIKDLRKEAVDFLDNGGGKGDEACSFCRGKKNPQSSDNPDKAIISLQNDRETKYKTYITVQNELIAAYNQLRNREYKRLYPNDGMNFVEANKKYNDPRTTDDNVKEKLKEKLEKVKALIPQKLSEAEPKSN